tara:strand:- start:36885 stop:37232 length:348 start_codon:yes stop_codon:yes gene_type:complete
MSADPQKADHSFKNKELKHQPSVYDDSKSVWNLFRNGHTLVPMLSGFIQLKIGTVLVFFSILGMVEPLWISALLSIFGSILFMLGGFLIYHTITSLGSFDSIVNKAIRKAIRFQN